eukprot:Gb_11882 [translate_table: standard]
MREKVFQGELASLSHLTSSDIQSNNGGICVQGWKTVAGKDSRSFGILQWLPSSRVLAVFFVSGVVTRLSERKLVDHENFFASAAAHVGVGITCFAVLSAVMYP